jgi:hypothetical protein
MTEKIAALAFVFVFALVFSIVVLGLLTAYRDRRSGLSAGGRATKREWPVRTTPHTNFPLRKIISVAVLGFALLSAAPAHGDSAKTTPRALATRGGVVTAPLPFIECGAGTYQNSSATCVPDPTQPDPSQPQTPRLICRTHYAPVGPARYRRTV